MMASGKELADNVGNIIEVEEKKANSMRVIEFDRQSTLFLVKELLNPRQWHLPKKFVVNIYAVVWLW